MNFFKSIAAIAATAATTFAAGPAQASEITYGQSQLLNSLNIASVTYDVGVCEAGVEGWYLPSHKHIRICDGATNPWETMRHEAVHAAQHCENDLEGSIFAFQELEKREQPGDWEFIMSAYPSDHWITEYEAFTLMKFDNQTIANIVNDACN
jgi:hypothetical protein